jgi:hypothetical protein
MTMPSTHETKPFEERRHFGDRRTNSSPSDDERRTEDRRAINLNNFNIQSENHGSLHRLACLLNVIHYGDVELRIHQGLPLTAIVEVEGKKRKYRL